MRGSREISLVPSLHRASTDALILEPLSDNIQAIDDLSWNVSSARDGSITYVVKIVKETCTCNLRCSMCRACVHMYTCTCIDSTLHATVCKHAHAITSNPSIAFTPASQVDYFATILDDGGENSNLEELQQQLLKKINEISVLVATCETPEALKTTSGHLSAAITAIKALQRHTPLTQTSRKRIIPPNKN